MADFLILIRSGTTDFDLQDRICGSLSIPLCAAGIAETNLAAAAMATMLPVALYTATAGCALETSRLIGRTLGLRPRRIANLENLNQGLWQGMLVDEIRRRQPRLYRQWQENPWSIAPPDGELLSEACERVEPVLEKLLRRHPSGRLALVVPEPLGRIVRWLIAGESLEDLWSRDPLQPVFVEIPLASQWLSGAERALDARYPTVLQQPFAHSSLLPHKGGSLAKIRP
ncbi:MAG: phosphoglycerate mutase family protein [Planctomycetia bacterium]|nr:phosphoglycerate mutase family protein [Planctomycetia bacterium]RLT16077.1 MAG: histidine phosphatase family protein [Planctomycetota bacterium]